jgi:hypothetical protein
VVGFSIWKDPSGEKFTSAGVLILVWTTFLSEAAPSGCLSRTEYTPLGKLLQKEISFLMGKPKQFYHIQKQDSL